VAMISMAMMRSMMRSMIGGQRQLPYGGRQRVPYTELSSFLIWKLSS